MCGIAGVYLRDPDFRIDNLDAMLDTMLDEIEHRGGDATGYLALNAEGVAEWHRAACDVRDFTKYRRPVPKGTRTIMAHTRYATQGLPGFIENNHPIKRGPFYVIHNGHVSNDQQLFKLAGRRPFGQVDSEAIPARLASLGKLTDAEIVMEEIEGAAAIAAVDESNPDELLLAKGHSSPLFVLVTNKVVIWGSTKATVEQAYKKHIGRIPKRRKIEDLSPGQMIHFKGKKQTRTKFVPYSPKYVSYTYTPKAWEETGETNIIPTTGGDACSVPPTRHLPTVGGFPQWDDTGADDDSHSTECDVCGDKVRYQDALYVDDPTDSRLTWVVCSSSCEDEALWDGDISEDPQVVNAAILKDRGELSDIQ